MTALGLADNQQISGKALISITWGRAFTAIRLGSGVGKTMAKTPVFKRLMGSQTSYSQSQCIMIGLGLSFMLSAMEQKMDGGMFVVPLMMRLEVGEEGKAAHSEGHFSGP